MRFKKQSIFAIASLSIATAGVLSIPYFAAATNPVSWRGDRMAPQRVAMHSGPMRSGPMHSGSMMHPMQMQIANEFEFLSQMIPHHEEAIATAQRVLQFSDRPEMQTFAREIIEVQSAEVEQMKAWLDEWYPDQHSSQVYTPMMRDLSLLEGSDLDQAFLEDMIMHHMHAVMMSQMLIRHGLVTHDPVQPFAQNIANTQRQEIWQMRSWLQDWYGVAGRPGGMQEGMQGGCMGM